MLQMLLSRLAIMAGVLLVLMNTMVAIPLYADTFDLKATVTSSNYPAILPGDEWFGVITTNGTCSVCNPMSGALTLSLDFFGNIFHEYDNFGYPFLGPEFDVSTLNLKFEDRLLVAVFCLSSIDPLCSGNADYSWSNFSFGPGPLGNAEQGTYVIAPAVPEPACAWLVAVALLVCWQGCRMNGPSRLGSSNRRSFWLAKLM